MSKFARWMPVKRNKLLASPKSASTQGSVRYWKLDLNNQAREGKIVLDQDHPLRLQIEMIQLTEEDLSILRWIKPYILEYMDEMTESFYKTILGVDELKLIIEKYSSIDRLKKTLRQHIEEMFNGIIDEEYVQKRLMIATKHLKIGLDTKWYIGAFHNLQSELTTNIILHMPDAEAANEVIRAVNKVLNLEQRLVLEIYEERFRKEREQQYNQVKNELKNNISHLSEQLALLTQETSNTIEALIKRGVEINETVKESSISAHEAEDKASEGEHLMIQFNAGIQIIESKANEMHENVSTLKDTSNRIRTIVSAVKEIADQTNLLSLNASIEAARAGEHGAGFAVVAKEVNKLATHTKQTVADIEKLIGNSANVTNTVIHMITEVKNNVDGVREWTAVTNDAFRDIVEKSSISASSMKMMMHEMKELMELIQGIDVSTQEVAKSAEELNQTTLSL
ncbi:protoglobin domain-containing protein [Paenibacillus marinisediminis]